MNPTPLDIGCQEGYVRDVTDSELLEEVAQAYEARRQARSRVHAAVIAARDAGISHDRIAEFAQVTRPSVIDTEKRARRAAEPEGE